MQDYDLIIVGGGLVGAGLAAALQESTLRVALIDARLPSQHDPRLFGLTSSSCQFLKNLALWPAVAAHASPIHRVHVSCRGHFGALRLNREEIGLPELGHVIPAYLIETALNERLATAPHVTHYRPATLETLTQQHDFATLRLTTAQGEKIVGAPLVIGADGTDSTVRAQLNGAVKTVDYQQSAIVTRTRLQRFHDHVAYERFYAQGAIAMLPLSAQECATIWTADHDTIAHLMRLSDTLFLSALQKTFGYRLGRLQSISKRHCFPLRMLRAEKMLDQCVLLLGNAAHTLHPIAAQGFNLALYEVAVLAEALLKKTANHEVFKAADLQSVHAHIHKQQAVSMGLSHRLSQVFSQRSALMSLALPLGMVGLDRAAPIKKRIINRLIGRSGSVPLLLS